MKFSLVVSPQRHYDDIVDLAMHSDRLGWEGFYVVDHFMRFTTDESLGSHGSLDCWSVLSALARETKQVRLGTLVCAVGFRHPVLLAHLAASVDEISGGRITLGMGAGWQANEHLAYGFGLPPVEQRLDRLEEACTIVSGLLRNERTTYRGRHYEVTDAPLFPRPRQANLPILIGGAGERRTMRIAARHADAWNTWLNLENVDHKLEVLRQHCVDVGRPPDTLRVTTMALLFMSEDPRRVRRMRQRGQHTPEALAAEVGISVSDLERGGYPYTTEGRGPAFFGTPEEIVDTLGQLSAKGVAEVIVADFNLASGPERREFVDCLNERVVPRLR